MANLERYEIRNTGSKVGYKDCDNNVVIEPLFESGVFSFGIDSYHKTPYGIVSKDRKCGVINEIGDVVIPFKYDEIFHLFEDVFAVRIPIERDASVDDNNDWAFGVINTNGDIVIPFQYKYITSHNNYIQCFGNAKSEYKHRDHSMGSDARVYSYTSFYDEVWYNKNWISIFQGRTNKVCGEFLAIIKDDKVGLLDINGNVIIQPKYDDIIFLFGDYFAAKINTNQTVWNFGVIDSNDKCILDFKYRYIEGCNNTLFHCFDFDTKDRFYQDNYATQKSLFSNDWNLPLIDEKWINIENKLIYKGKGKVLDNNLLAVKKQNKWGAIDCHGAMILSYMYDDISSIEGFLIIKKDGCCGLLHRNGRLLIDPSYTRIECVNIEDKIAYDNWKSVQHYCKYSKEYYFDTEGSRKDFRGNNLDLLDRVYIDSRNCSSLNRFDINKYFILTTSQYSELFNSEDGIIENSRYDYITQITNISFVVKKNNKYGVYRADQRLEIIPCEYDRIKFEGGHTVLLNKDGKWGAKTLVMPSHLLYDILKVDIPLNYLDIKILDDGEFAYGVKKYFGKSENVSDADYTILHGSDGSTYQKMSSFAYKMKFDSQFTMYNTDKIMTCTKGKYGFISARGYVSIPFKYDEIIEREDGNFNVRVNSSWGILTIDGFEKVAIKYLEVIPDKYSLSIVQDYATHCRGVLDENGLDLIPPIYEHLMVQDDYIFFGYNGYKGMDGNFFSNTDGATWGCMDKKGRIIIDPKYDCYKVQDEYILAGRNGGMITSDDNCYGKEYGGVFDLYTRYGELLIGGFSIFSSNEKYLFFYFGGNWERYCSYQDDWNNISVHDYRFTRKNGGWLILDRDLNSVIFDDSGSPYQFRKGTLVELSEKKNDQGKIIARHRNIPVPLVNIPNDDTIPDIQNGYLFEGNQSSKWIRRISDNIKSDKYDDIHSIGSDVFYVEQDGKVGIITIDKTIVDIYCVVITYPVGGYIFTARQNDNDKFSIELINIENETFEKVVIFDEIDWSEVKNLFYKRKLKLEHIGSENKIENFTIKDIHINEVCQSIFVESPDAFKNDSYKEKYWFSLLDLPPYIGREHEYDEDVDYAKDTWDAMTDGMYGDYPGGDVDYDTLGF